MPDQKESIPSPIPHLDPAAWEEHEGFRETFLLHYTEPEANTTLRHLGSLLFNLALESSGGWPHHPGGVTRSELQAALADLRYLQGFLASVGREHLVSSLNAADDTLSRFAAERSEEVGRIADRIEEELGQWDS